MDEFDNGNQARMPTSFFRQRHEELMRDKNSLYISLSGPERKKFIEVEYDKKAKAECQEKIRIEAERKAEHQARLRAKAERQERIKAESEVRERAFAEYRMKVEAYNEERWRAENERIARINTELDSLDKGEAKNRFYALREMMSKTTNRTELGELGRQRDRLAKRLDYIFIYENHCWRCGEHISSAVHAQCPNCKYYICACGACLCGYS